SWYRPADEKEVIFLVDLDDVEVADGALGVPVLAGGLVTLFRPAAAAVAGHRADRAALTMHFFGAVGGRHALKVVALHDARKAAPLGSADDIDTRRVLKNVGSRQNGADLGLGRTIEPELADVALGLAIGL